MNILDIYTNTKQTNFKRFLDYIFISFTFFKEADTERPSHPGWLWSSCVAGDALLFMATLLPQFLSVEITGMSHHICLWKNFFLFLIFVSILLSYNTSPPQLCPCMSFLFKIFTFCLFLKLQFNYIWPFPFLCPNPLLYSSLLSFKSMSSFFY